MTTAHKARIRWLSAATGGRQTFPAGPKYSTVARFPSQSDWEREAWSIVADFDGPVNEGGEVTADIRFLSASAPHDLLCRGGTFELYEGAKKVAEGVVLT